MAIDLRPREPRPDAVSAVIEPSLSTATFDWAGLWFIASVCTLAFWGVARLLRRWLVPRRLDAARWVGLTVGVVVAAFGSFMSFALGSFGGIAFNLAYLRDDGRVALAMAALASLAPGVIAGVLFLRTLVPRLTKPPLPMWPMAAPGQIWSPSPPPAPLPQPTYGLPPDPNAGGLPSWWDPPAQQHAPPLAPPMPTFAVPPLAPPPPVGWMPPPTPPRVVIPPESKGRVALLLGLFGGAMPLLGGVAALFASRAARMAAPRRAELAKVLGLVQLGTWSAFAVLYVLAG